MSIQGGSQSASPTRQTAASVIGEPKTPQADQTDEQTAAQINLRLQSAKADALELDNTLRADQVRKLYRLLKWWLIAVGVLTFAAGLNIIEVSDAVLIAAITTSTANVIGLYAVVAGWLFPSRKGRDN
ncbi:MAG: hypothetical protein AAF823_13800 [Planctomycetota bacterium]